jgi:cell division protein ZapA
VHEGRETVARAESDIAAAQALAGSAVGEIDELKSALANCNAEVQQLQEANQNTAHEIETAQTRIAELSGHLAERHANESALHQQIEALTLERDALVARPATVSESLPPEADLSPALERLAEMLEQCADKLEGTTATT